MKRSILLTTLLTVSNIYAAKNPFQGPYLSLGAGATNANVNTNQYMRVNIPSATNAFIPNNVDAFANNVSGAVGLGYTKVINPQFALGIEAASNFYTTKISRNSHVEDQQGGFNLSNNVTVKLKNSFALLVKPGWIVNQKTLMYLLMGPRWGNFETTTQTTFISPSGTSSVVGIIPKTMRSGYKLGVTLGGGIEEYIGKGFSLGLEYAYTDYGYIRTAGSQSSTISNTETSAPIGTLTNNLSKIRAKTNTVMLNIVYRIL